MTRREFRELSSPAEAEETIASLNIAPEPERVSLSAARGRVLAERIDAEIDVPGFDRASLDGYALRAADTFGADEAAPTVLTVVDEVHAGATPSTAVEAGEAVEISTGAVMPPGADAMVPVEQTEVPDATEDRRVRIRTAVAPGDNVMFAGTDVAAGERALGPGTVITPREIGLLSALGVDEVPVRGTPTVGIISTGDELVRPGDPIDHNQGQIHDVNSYSIAAAVEEAGGEAVLYPHVGDDYDDLERQLRSAAEDCDLVLSSGSTSASAVDVVYQVIEDRGDLLLHGVALKPGKATLIGRLGGAPYVGLPGYPVSAMMVFRTLVAPVIREAAGLPERDDATVTGTFAVEERFTEGRQRLLPVGVLESAPGGEDGSTPIVYPVDKGSGATTSLSAADGIVTVPPDTAYVGAGESVAVELFSAGLRYPALLGVGEDDPLFARILDRLDRTRYLSVGSRPGLRRLRDGVPDFCLVAGPVDREVDGTELGRWTREWGLIVPPGNPEAVGGVTDLVDDDLRFVNRTTNSGLRASLGAAIASLAEERGIDRHELVEAIDGFENARRAHESPARLVKSGSADVGLGLGSTAAELDLGFVSLGSQPVRVLAADDRLDKPAFGAFRTALEDLGPLCSDLVGVAPE